MINNIALDRPICFLKIETTGLNFKEDKIIEIYIKKVLPSKEIQEYSYLFDPKNTPVTKEAQEKHGHTNASLKGNPEFKEMQKYIEEFIGDSHLAGFYIMRFDIPFLMEEFYRCGIVFNFKKNNRKIIDIKNIYTKHLNPGSLNFAYNFFFNKEIELRTLQNNIDATIEIFNKEVELLDLKDLSSIETYSKMDDYFDLSGKILFKDEVFLFNFGKYYGKSIIDCFENDPDYYKWLLNSDSTPIDTKYILKTLFTYWKNKKI